VIFYQLNFNVKNIRYTEDRLIYMIDINLNI